MTIKTRWLFPTNKIRKRQRGMPRYYRNSRLPSLPLPQRPSRAVKEEVEAEAGARLGDVEGHL
jgi:hypothetical protein